MTNPVRLIACAGCGAPLVPRAATCEACGSAVEAAQRRVVTLLFADLAGYTTLCETRDPEQVHLLVRPLMNALRALCEERGGLVPGIQGDGFMAVFGGRTAQEDDPARALDAAVHLQRVVEARRSVLSELPGLRVGLHVGEVLVASSWEPAGLSVSGDPVNVASRVCGHAAAGEVVVTTEAVDLIRADLGWTTPRELQLRGRDAPVSVRSFDWRQVPDVVRGPRWSATTPYVARKELEDALLEVIGSAPGALVVGDAGMGKTRLVHHLLEGDELLEVACSTAFRPTACGVSADLLDQLADPPSDLVRLLRGGASGGLADEALLLRAAGVRLAEAVPDAVVLVDDGELLPEAEAVLLAEVVRSSGLRWVVASREARPVLGLTEVRVLPWTTDEASRLLDETLPRASSELKHAVLVRAGDCPLYVEQCAQLLLDNGAVEVDAQGTHVLEPELLREIPSSMRLFVSSRLDLLPADQRAVLGTAAVLGPEPDLALLGHLAGQDAALVEPLVQRGFLRWVPGPAGQPELRFSHALVRDVAYETMLRSRRVEIHRAAAEWYAVLPVSQVLESQAFHLEAAVQLAEPDCELLRRTVDAMVLYARSIEEERTRTGLEVLRRARALVASRPECAPDTLSLELAWATVNELAGEHGVAQVAAEAALELATAREDGRAMAEAHLHLGRAHRYLDDARAADSLDQSAALYELEDDLAGVARVEIERGIQAEHRQGLVHYLGYLERAYLQAMRSADVRLQASCIQLLAMHHAFAYGRHGFEKWAGEAREVARRDDVGLEPRLDVAAGALGMFGLDPLAGLEPVRRALSAGRDLGLEHVYSNALVVTIDLLVLSGRHDEAALLLGEAHEYARTRPTPWLSLQFDLLEARVLQRTGRVAEGIDLLDAVAGHDLVEQRVLRRDLAEARAWVALERGRFGEAHALAAEAVAVDEELGERCAPLRPRLIDLVATVVGGDSVPLGTIAALRAEARETGLITVAQLATRWLYVDELTHGWTVDLHGVEPCGVIECRALDLEIEALSTRRWELLVEAAAVWSELGTTVWQARALLWHSELTGTTSPEADDLLATLQSPAGLGETLRAQVRALST